MTTRRFPPTLHQLLEDETYYTYFCRKPKIPGISPTPPWMIMVQTIDLRWKRALCDTYKEAVHKANWILDRPETYRDISIISRRRIFKEPSWVKGLIPPTDRYSRWCGRCRRPSLFFVYGRSHPAMKDAPVIVENQRRCFFCGIRENYGG